VPVGASGSSSIRTRLFVPAGIPSHETAGDSLAPLQLLVSGRDEPGASEPTLIIKAPDGAEDDTGWNTGCTGTGDDGVEGEGATEVHPQERRREMKIMAESIDQRLSIT